MTIGEFKIKQADFFNCHLIMIDDFAKMPKSEVPAYRYVNATRVCIFIRMNHRPNKISRDIEM